MEDLRSGVCGGHPVSGEGHDGVGQGVGVQRLAGQQGVHLDTGRVSGGDNLWTSVAMAMSDGDNLLAENLKRVSLYCTPNLSATDSPRLGAERGQSQPGRRGRAEGTSS